MAKINRKLDAFEIFFLKIGNIYSCWQQEGKIKKTYKKS